MNSRTRRVILLGILLCLMAVIAAGAEDQPAAREQPPGRFIVHCNVEGATVLLDDTEVGIIQNGILSIDVNSSEPRYGTFTVKSPEKSRLVLWVKEGNDLMFSSYGISPQMATNTMIFEGTLPNRMIESAELFLVAPSGGYSRDIEVEINSLMVNQLEEEKTPPLIRTIFSLLFPNYKGKDWSDIFNMDNATQIGFEKKEIKPYLKTENNRVMVRDQGDYFQLNNAILRVRFSGEQA
ncbi:MAG: DUF3344 domain-containing protein [Methanoregulaceae archaeon]|jgi:hypothetical protein